MDNSEKGFADGEVEWGSEDKIQSRHVDEKDKNIVPAIALAPTRMFQAPEFIRNMTPEERLVVETNLKRKIDMRLMPMIILM